MGRKALKRRAAAARDAAQAGHGEAKKMRESTEWSNWANQRREDGRFLRAENGQDICFEWSRNEGGCASPCAGHPPRVHCCEWCRQPHRSVACPTHPGWKPNPKGKGGGKGKGGKAKGTRK